MRRGGGKRRAEAEESFMFPTSSVEEWFERRNGRNREKKHTINGPTLVGSIATETMGGGNASYAQGWANGRRNEQE